MPRITYMGKTIKLPYTKKGRRMARKLKRRSRNSMSAFSAGDDCYKMMRSM